jgi:hypothetical protein
LGWEFLEDGTSIRLSSYDRVVNDRLARSRKPGKASLSGCAYVRPVSES